MTCISAIEAMMARNSKVCEYVAKKEVLKEISEITETLVSNNEDMKDLKMIAKIVVQVERTNEGKTLVDGMKMSFCAFEKLRNEMKKYTSQSNPGDFAFDSDKSGNVKAECHLK